MSLSSRDADDAKGHRGKRSTNSFFHQLWDRESAAAVAADPLLLATTTTTTTTTTTAANRSGSTALPVPFAGRSANNSSKRHRQQKSAPSACGGVTGSAAGLIALGLGCTVGAIVSVVRVHRLLPPAAPRPFSTGKNKNHYSSITEERGMVAAVLSEFKQPALANTEPPPPQEPHYHTLQCADYGGPSERDAQEMVYWQDIPSDSHYVSPFHAKRGQRRQYMTFEPDGGGWNNIRMAMETVVGLAIATGRTLVLPPEQRMYLLGQGGGGTTTKTDFSFVDFFPMQELANDNDGLTMITMQEFLETEAMTGRLLDTATGLVAFPPDNRTDWNGMNVKLLKEWLRNVTHTPLWSPSQCLAVFPASGEHRDAVALRQMLGQVLSQLGQPPPPPKENGHDLALPPLPVDAATVERLRDSLVNRRELCLYDESMQAASVLHFMCNHKRSVRMLVHFYAFLFFEDWREDLWMKRFMRDHMRYVDELQCAAARIVAAVREHARHNLNATGHAAAGDFDAFHIRRGDFQYKNTRIGADEIYNNVKDVLAEGATIYIATDERSKAFFDPLRAHYDVLFMDDFLPQLKGVNKNQYGMIDQLVASRGRLFFGCWHSTFTGFINRMRGYHSVRDKLPGHEDGLLPNSYYYVPKGQKLVMHSYTPVVGAFFNREFPTSWRQLDKGIGNLPNVLDH